MNADNFSVIIPTHNRSDMVATLFGTLDKAQSIYPGEVEVLVVDSSVGEAELIIRDLCDKNHASYLRCTNHVTKKRNLGLREAVSKYIFFTDSDCEVSPQIFVQHAQTYKSAPDNIGGVLGLTIISGELAPIWKILRFDTSFTAAFSFAHWLEHAPWGTCTNLSFRRDILLKAGGFDDTWPLVVYGEDVDLGIRINESGYKIVCNNQAVVRHNSTTLLSSKQVLLKKFRTGQADYYLGQKHSEKLSPEFPGWIAISILLFFVLLVKSLIVRSFCPIFFLIFFLLGGVACQSIFTIRATGTDWRSFLQHAAVILFEATFDVGRLSKAIRHGKFHRLWTKFVYVEQQLIGERNKRIRQVWAYVIITLLLIVFIK